jgi:hypothetical protein
MCNWFGLNREFLLGTLIYFLNFVLIFLYIKLVFGVAKGGVGLERENWEENELGELRSGGI